MRFSKADLHILKGKLMSNHKKLSNGCWEWTRSVRGSGYGTIWFAGSFISVHRLAMEIFKPEDFIKDLMVLHSCNNKRCINPAHLSMGTQVDNMLDRVIGKSIKGKYHKTRSIK